MLLLLLGHSLLQFRLRQLDCLHQIGGLLPCRAQKRVCTLTRHRRCGRLARLIGAIHRAAQGIGCRVFGAHIGSTGRQGRGNHGHHLTAVLAGRWHLLDMMQQSLAIRAWCHSGLGINRCHRCLVDWPRRHGRPTARGAARARSQTRQLGGRGHGALPQLRRSGGHLGSCHMAIAVLHCIQIARRRGIPASRCAGTAAHRVVVRQRSTTSRRLVGKIP
mmetsp:Transcript_56232/g.122985  ORF Transcript_56232/g.122985 Transcript_56232/m.122985 type:complete len:218 (+) Transcript_56232:791-1444(+)